MSAALDSEHIRSASLDALALIACAVQGRREDGDLLLSTYTAEERDELLAAVLAHAASALKALAASAGVTPEVALGGIFAMLRGMP